MIAPPPQNGPSAPVPGPTGAGLYPSLGDYMGLNIQHYKVCVVNAMEFLYPYMDSN